MLSITACREIKELVGDDWREAAEEIRSGEHDFEVSGYRFIRESELLDIMVEELESEAYVLGCFSDWAIADATGWPAALIEAAQSKEAFEALGEAIIAEGHTRKLAERYAQLDGWGHHFAHWDHNEDEIAGGFYAFRVN